jgi:hypothetical protein
MTSDPNLDDVGYEKNGTGLQKKKLSSSSGRGSGDDKGTIWKRSPVWTNVAKLFGAWAIFLDLFKKLPRRFKVSVG